MGIEEPHDDPAGRRANPATAEDSVQSEFSIGGHSKDKVDQATRDAVSRSNSGSEHEGGVLSI
jgi:hypothetical protein